MNKFRIILVVAIILAALGMQAGQANAMAFSYTSGIQIQNLANANATVVLTYYSAQAADGSAGVEATSASVNMLPLATATFFPIHASAGFKGSVVISSSQPVASIANLVGSSGSTHIGDASYIGIGSGALTASLPLLHFNNYGFFSWYSVQNAGSANAAVSVTYSDGVKVGPITVKPGASYTFDQAAETNHTQKVLSAVVTSNQPVVVVVVQENTTGKTIQAYTGFDTAEADTLMPLINANNYGFITGVQLQNTSATEAANITITYTPGVAGTKCTETHQVPAKKSVTYALGAFTYGFTTTATDKTTCVKGQRFVGSAQVTGNVGVTSKGKVNINAVVNQATPTSADAYDGFIPSRATGKVVLPLIMDRNYGWYTGFNLMNVGTVAVNVTCTFTKTAYKVTQALAPGATFTDVQNGKIADKYVGSGTCVATSTSGTPKINVVVNQISPNANDNLLVYPGINQ